MTGQSEYEDDIADYVLGVLDSGERARFEERLARDAALKQKVAALETRLHALDDTVDPEEVPSDLWKRIEAGLGAQDSPSVSNGKRARTALPRWAAMAAAIVVSLGIGFLGGQGLRTEPEQPLVVAVLLDDDQVPGAVVEAFGDDSVRLVPLERLVAPEGSTLEVWTLPDPGTGPVSLGTFQQAHELILGGPDLPQPQPDQLYEITLEPAGGSPTGRPTGPILLKGFARAPII